MDKNASSKAHVATAGPTSPIAAGTASGSPLFVINLCASIAPVETAGRNMPGLENYRLYQVARIEEGRPRHRLRLGFFTSESHAESVLTIVRQQYPTAFTTCLCDEDRRFTRGYLPETAAAPKPAAPPAPVHTAALAAQPAAKAPIPTPAKPAAAKPAAAKTLAPAEPEVIELMWEPEAPAAKQAAPANTAPVAKQAAPKRPLAPTDGLDEFTWEGPALPTNGKAQPTPAASTSDTQKQPILKTAPKAEPAKTPAVAKPPVTKPAAAAPVAAAPAARVNTASSMRVRALDLSLAQPAPVVAEPKRSTAPAEPFHVGKGVQIADVGITLQAETPASKTPAKTKIEQPAPKPAARPAAPAAKALEKPVHRPPAHTPAPPQVRVNGPVPELDSTQTIRALTSAELEEGQEEKWFAVQLAVSEQPVNLDAMPRLDIFEAYRLYSVATAGSGKIVHSLRLGFFKEAVSAEAVCGYLKTFFGSPTILRVSVAEHARFKDPPSKKPAHAAAKHEAKVVELNRGGRPVVPTVTMEVTTPQPDTAATGSFKVNATGTHKALGSQKSAAKNGTATKRAAASSTRTRTGTTGRHKVLPPPKKSLAEQLLDEAREVELSESGIRKLPKNDSLLSRLVGKLTK